MKLLAAIRNLFFALFRRAQSENEMREELLAHLKDRADDLVRSGLTRAAAERRARIEFGASEKFKEEIREATGANFFNTLLQDVRFGFRILRKSPGFTAVAILTLALGIGANTAIFSYVDAWLIKPLPYPQADRLMVFLTHDKQRGWTGNNISAADLQDFQKQNSAFDTTVGWWSTNFNLTSDGPPVLVEAGQVSWNFFDVLGVKPIHGRTFSADDDRSGAGHVVIISEGLWRDRFASDPGIINRSVRIDDELYTVIGVMPGTFQFTLMGIANMWTPLALTDQQLANRGTEWLSAFGRLKPGATQQQAGAEGATIFSRLEKEYPKTNTNLTLLFSSMTAEVGKNEGVPQVMICFWIVGLILLIACANVANLMMARATRRSREFVVRRTLGAGKGRLIRQLLAESLVLFFFGGIAGTLFGAWGMHWIQTSIPDKIRGYLVNFGEVKLDFVTLSFTLALTMGCAIIFGLAPALEGSRFDLSSTLKETSSQSTGSRGGGRLRRILVGAEIALAVIVLISTTLLVRSFILSVSSNAGFNSANLTIAQLDLPKTRYAHPADMRNFNDAVIARLRTLPQVVSVGAASGVPFGGYGQIVVIAAVGKPPQKSGEELGARMSSVSADYLATMQMQLLQGRAINSSDGPNAPPSVVISETLAKLFWANENPVGQKLQFGADKNIATVVGVVKDIKMYNLRSRPERQLYVPFSQFPTPTMGFVVRTQGKAPAIAAGVRDEIWSVDRDQPMSSVEQLDNLMAITDTGNRMLTKLMVFFGLLATFLGAIGIYGLISQMVSQRIHEIGIRVALGASPRQVMRMVLREGLKLALIGITLGVLLSLAVTRSLAFALYGVQPTDLVTFVGVPALFTMVAIAACYIPAQRAMRVDPMVALRYE
ncbi:MAG TPA: ABC transporter permease [Candidatus Acidoferrum sp.]|jgi:putative ABC transport system permease protein